MSLSGIYINCYRDCRIFPGQGSMQLPFSTLCHFPLQSGSPRGTKIRGLEPTKPRCSQIQPTNCKPIYKQQQPDLQICSAIHKYTIPLAEVSTKPKRHLAQHNTNKV